MEKKIYFDDSYFDKIEEQKKIDTVDNQQMSDKDELNKKNYIEFIYADNKDIKVSPVGGYGNKVQSVKVFEKNYRFSQNEWGLITTDKSKPNVVVSGGVSSVKYDILGLYRDYYFLYFTTGIQSHVHPPDAVQEDEEYVTFNKYWNQGHSMNDLAMMIYLRPVLMETRVVTRFSTFVFQKPKMGWKQWEKIYSEFGEKIDDDNKPNYSPTDIRSDDIAKLLNEHFYKFYDKWEQYFLDLYPSNINETYLSSDEDMEKETYRLQWIENETYHLALHEISKKYKLPYARYNIEHAYNTMNKRKLTVKERKRIKGMIFLDENGQRIMD